MSAYNISELPEQERRNIELKRQACLLRFKFVRRMITRNKVNNVIESFSGNEKELFRRYVNEAKGR